jgi:hypothetical protein
MDGTASSSVEAGAHLVTKAITPVRELWRKPPNMRAF